MAKSKKIMRALLANILSVVLCIAMLVGSTFAWFTDSVTSGKNKIVAGNLDVELEYSLDGTTWTPVDENTNIFKEDALWEPGYTEVVYLQVKNEGSLALKYKFGINVADKELGETEDGQPIDLSDFIKFGVVDGVEQAYSVDAEGRTAARDAVKDSAVLVSEGYSAEEGHLTREASSPMMALVVYMPEEVENDANHGKDKAVPSISLGLILVATQDTVESDSFDENYDEGAEYPVTTQADFNEALENAKAGDEIHLASGTYVMPQAKYEFPSGVSMIGENGTVISLDGANPGGASSNGYGMKIEGDDVTIANVTMTGKDIGIDQYDSVVRITGNNVTLDNVTIHSEKEDASAPRSSAAVIISNTKGSENVVTIKNSDLFSTYKAVHIVDGTEGTVNIEGCTLEGTYGLQASTTSTYAINVKDSEIKGYVSYGNTATKAVFENCTFAPRGSKAFLIAYADTDLINCNFDPYFFPETKNNYQKTMTFTNCYRGETKITADNLLQEFHVDNDSDSIDQATGWKVIVEDTTVLSPTAG